MKTAKHLFESEIAAFIGAAICCIFWGSGFPCIKLSYVYFNIDANDTAAIILFIGIRFTLVGLVIMLFRLFVQRGNLLPKRKSWPKIILLQFFQPTFAHIFFYIALAHATGVKSSLISGLTMLFTVLMSCYMFRLENMTAKKILGCMLCLAGVLCYNLGDLSFSFHFMGEGMLILYALTSAIGSNLIKIGATGEDSVVLSSWQYLIGGVLTMVVGWLMGGRVIQINLPAVLMMVYLVVAAAVAFTMWAEVLKYHDVSKISIYRVMEPITGVVVSILALQESVVVWKTCIALLLVCMGIFTVNYKGRKC